MQQQSIRRLVLIPPHSVFCSISFRCGGLSIERNQKPLTPENTLAVTHHDKQKQVEVKRSNRANPHEIRLFSGCPYYISSPAPFNGRNRLLTDSLVLRFTSIVIFRTAHMMSRSVVACHLTALLRHPCAQLFYHDLHAALSRPPFVAKNSKPQFLFHFPFPVAFPI